MRRARSLDCPRRDFNFAERPTPFEDLFDAETARRLSQWDPDGVIRANHTVPAAA